MITDQPTQSEIFSVYNRLRAEARRAGDDKQVERLDKALGILQSKNYYQGERSIYLPTVEWCGCKDWEYRDSRRRGTKGPCKHIWAERMAAEIHWMRETHRITEWVDARYTLTSSYQI